MAGGSTTEQHATYNNFVVNSLSCGKSPLEALDSNGGLTGAWTDSRPARELNTSMRDVCTDTGLRLFLCLVLSDVTSPYV